MVVIMNDGSIIEGTIERETDTELWIDETKAFGDIVIVNKGEIAELKGEK